MSTDEDDRTARLLARALAEKAAQVDPDPGALQAIQQRTVSAPRPVARSARRPWMLGALGAGLATAGVVTAIVLVVDNGGKASPNALPPATQPSTGSTTGQQTGGTVQPVQQVAPHQGVYDPSAPAADQFTVYYPGPLPSSAVGDLTQTPHLYAETHTVTDPGDDRSLAALNELLSSTPIDPDYTAWLPRGVYATAITHSGADTTVHLAGHLSALSIGALPHPSPAGFSQNEGVAIQGLLRTIGANGPVAFTYNDEPIAMFELNDVSPSISLVPDDEQRALISIDNLVEGQTVSNPVTVLVSGNTFEGTVNWELLDSSGAKVDDGFVTTAMGSWRQVGVDLGTLQPGTYTFKALEYSPEDGSPGNIDDKTFTVE